jgi:hypothetical protein
MGVGRIAVTTPKVGEHLQLKRLMMGMGYLHRYFLK